MTILGFNPSHHGSVCLLEDGELKFFIQEERITRKKYTPFPFKSFINILQTSPIDHITWSPPSIMYYGSTTYPFPYWYILAASYYPEVIYNNMYNNHHRTHCAHAFYNSGFKESIGIVIDGAGSIIKDTDNTRETETIFKCSYPHNFEVLQKTTTDFNDSKGPVNLSRIYETITMHLGWSRDEAGKTMGLAPYGNPNTSLPDFFKDKQGSNVFIQDPTIKPKLPLQDGTFIDEKKYPQLKLLKDPRDWHYDKSKITDLEKDLAWKVQNDTQQLVGDYIEEAIKETGLKQVCCAGGYFLNCVTNYYLLKRFPDVEFYFEPIPHDAGTAIGSAKLIWHSKTKDTTPRPFKSLYLGKQYTKNELLEGIKKYT